MEREPSVIVPDKVHWPDHITSEQLARMANLCKLKNARVVVADEIEGEGLFLRDRIKQIFGSQDQRLSMINAYARVGQEIRWADDSLNVWREELGRGNFIPLNTPRQRNLRLLLNDPKGFELLEKFLLEKSDNGELSLSEIEGFAAGALRYGQLYEALILAGVKPKELEERFYPPVSGGARPLLHRRKPIPKEGDYKVVGGIVPGKVLIDEAGDYHIFLDKRHSFFQDIHGVLRQLERIIENYQGDLISIGDRVLEIEGEIPQVARFARRLTMISAGFRDSSFQTPQTRQKLLGELGELKDEIGQVRNELKKQGRDKIIIALSATKPKVTGEKTQEAAGDFLGRASDAATKLEGVLEMKRRVEEKRDEWERKIIKGFNILGAYLLELQEKEVPGRRFSERISQQIVESRENILADLQSITGQPYKARMEQPEIKNLSQIPEAARRGDLLLAKKKLEEAIKVLKAVVDEKANRERAEKSTS